MKVAVSSYVVTQTSLIVAWIIGLFNISVLFALIPTFLVIGVVSVMFCFLKLLDMSLGLDEEDDDFADILGVDDEEKEDEPNG